MSAPGLGPTLQFISFEKRRKTKHPSSGLFSELQAVWLCQADRPPTDCNKSQPFFFFWGHYPLFHPRQVIKNCDFFHITKGIVKLASHHGFTRALRKDWVLHIEFGSLPLAWNYQSSAGIETSKNKLSSSISVVLLTLSNSFNSVSSVCLFLFLARPVTKRLTNFLLPLKQIPDKQSCVATLVLFLNNLIENNYVFENDTQNSLPAELLTYILTYSLSPTFVNEVPYWLSLLDPMWHLHRCDIITYNKYILVIQITYISQIILVFTHISWKCFRDINVKSVSRYVNEKTFGPHPSIGAVRETTHVIRGWELSSLIPQPPWREEGLEVVSAYGQLPSRSWLCNEAYTKAHEKSISLPFYFLLPYPRESFYTKGTRILHGP